MREGAEEHERKLGNARDHRGAAEGPVQVQFRFKRTGGFLRLHVLLAVLRPDLLVDGAGRVSVSLSE